MEHVPDLKVVHVRFIKPQINRPSTSFVTPVSQDIMREENPAFSFMSECVRLRESPNKRKIKSERCSSSAAKRPAPKSLTVSQMIKLGKLIKPSVADTTHTMIIDVFSFDFSSLSWSVLPQTVEFTVENSVLGEGTVKCTKQFIG
jgi:hypothetical protein